MLVQLAGSCSCAGPNTCVSSYDDRPGHFVAPWEYDGQEAIARKQLLEAISVFHGEVQVQQDNYIYATFKASLGTDDAEFLFGDQDATVSVCLCCHKQRACFTTPYCTSPLDASLLAAALAPGTPYWQQCRRCRHCTALLPRPVVITTTALRCTHGA
jgi:hypothetical protein